MNYEVLKNKKKFDRVMWDFLSVFDSFVSGKAILEPKKCFAVIAPLWP